MLIEQSRVVAPGVQRLRRERGERTDVDTGHCVGRFDCIVYTTARGEERRGLVSGDGRRRCPRIPYWGLVDIQGLEAASWFSLVVY
jgi:hypothetical protein